MLMHDLRVDSRSKINQIQETPLVIECFNFNSNGKHDLLGKVQKSLAELEKLASSQQGEHLFLPIIVGKDHQNKGTASVVLVELISALKLVGGSLSDHRFLLLGAGEADIAITELIALEISKQTHAPLEDARKKVWLVDSKIHFNISRSLGPMNNNLLENFWMPSSQSRPTMLIGSSGVGHTFIKEVIEAMSSLNERYSKRLNERQITALLKVTCQRPQEREGDILKTVTHNAYGQDPHAKEFGIKISQKLASVEARILPAPWLKYHETGREKHCLPQMGQWNMMNKNKRWLWLQLLKFVMQALNSL